MESVVRGGRNTRNNHRRSEREKAIGRGRRTSARTLTDDRIWDKRSGSYLLDSIKHTTCRSHQQQQLARSFYYRSILQHDSVENGGRHPPPFCLYEIKMHFVRPPFLNFIPSFNDRIRIYKHSSPFRASAVYLINIWCCVCVCIGEEMLSNSLDRHKRVTTRLDLR